MSLYGQHQSPNRTRRPIERLLVAEPLKEEAKPLIWETWSEPIRQRCGSGFSDFRLMPGLVVVTFVALYIVFR
jgi:hypothetical protein